MTGLRDRLALWLAIATPALLLGGALGSQYIGGLAPCEMCYWQRWPHGTALLLALAAMLLVRRGWVKAMRALLVLAALAILASGLIGAFHAGVEYGWWEGLTSCANMAVSQGGDPLEAIMNAPVIRCDQVQWELLGISLAGWNFLFSLAAALAILLMIAPRRAIMVTGADSGTSDEAIIE